MKEKNENETKTKTLEELKVEELKASLSELERQTVAMFGAFESKAAAAVELERKKLTALERIAEVLERVEQILDSGLPNRGMVKDGVRILGSIDAKLENLSEIATSAGWLEAIAIRKSGR